MDSSNANRGNPQPRAPAGNPYTDATANYLAAAFMAVKILVKALWILVTFLFSIRKVIEVLLDIHVRKEQKLPDEADVTHTDRSVKLLGWLVSAHESLSTFRESVEGRVVQAIQSLDPAEACERATGAVASKVTDITIQVASVIGDVQDKIQELRTPAEPAPYRPEDSQGPFCGPGKEPADEAEITAVDHAIAEVSSAASSAHDSLSEQTPSPQTNPVSALDQWVTGMPPTVKTYELHSVGTDRNPMWICHIMISTLDLVRNRKVARVQGFGRTKKAAKAAAALKACHLVGVEYKNRPEPDLQARVEYVDLNKVKDGGEFYKLYVAPLAHFKPMPEDTPATPTPLGRRPVRGQDPDRVLHERDIKSVASAVGQELTTQFRKLRAEGVSVTLREVLGRAHASANGPIRDLVDVLITAEDTAQDAVVANHGRVISTPPRVTPVTYALDGPAEVYEPAGDEDPVDGHRIPAEPDPETVQQVVSLVRAKHPSPPRDQAETMVLRNMAERELQRIFDANGDGPDTTARKLCVAMYLDPVCTALEHVSPARSKHLAVRNAPSVVVKRTVEQLAAPRQ